ncbi:MAG: hypothetical protein ABSF34_13325 [Verrucomicrobiota bacterium]|jgi:hypothetical protein
MKNDGGQVAFGIGHNKFAIDLDHQRLPIKIEREMVFWEIHFLRFGFFFFTGGVASIADAICPTVKGCRLIAFLRGFLTAMIEILT